MSCFSCLFRGRDEELSGVHNVNLFTYNELRIATDDFNPINKVGEGGFGSVYKGRLKNGKIAAIKVLSAQSKLGARKFLTEIKVIADIEHENLVKLYGCCAEGNHRILVYNYLENNSLAQTLIGGGHSSMQFSWRTRTRICIGVARGLAFLHEEVQPHIVHRDIKASNILLDEDLTPKISDFGLAKLIPANMTHVSTRVAGTIGYLAPEYAIRGQLTRKADVYSFGVLLVETVSGRCNTNPRLPIEEQYLLERTWDLYERRELVGLVDTSLNGEFDAEQACRFLKIGLLCTQDNPNFRPSMSTVVKMLMGEIDIDGKEIKKPALISDFMDLKIKTRDGHGEGRGWIPLPPSPIPEPISIPIPSPIPTGDFTLTFIPTPMRGTGIPTGNRGSENRCTSHMYERGFRTPDKQNLSTPDPNSRGEEELEPLQLQMHQYSDAPFSISDRWSTSGAAPEGGVSFMEETVRFNEMGEVATKGQKLYPEDKESVSEVTESFYEELWEELFLEKLKETPSEPRELEELNCDPVEVPPTISYHFSALHVLDLSYTEIKSLPQSISRLIALQKLFLRSCELLMELPPEIGELTNLEVLDLEGTEILCLPKEIAKLVNLKRLKVSFYGYANQTVIPRRVLLNLSRLNELIIDVTPYGEWWDAEVEDITDDLFSLDELRTLKLYLPTAELLEGLTRIFSGLVNFRFTVGRHEEHFISRFPQNVEEEFNNWEKLEKGLKFINGNHIPNEITKVLKQANAFVLKRHWTAESLSEFGHENMNEVKFCLVMECNELQTIVDCEQFYQGKDGRGESEDFKDFDEAIVLGSLEKLIIRYMKNMVSIWKGLVGKGSLSNLKSLALHTCPNLTALFTIDMLRNLMNLEELIVEDCPKIESLVSLKSTSSNSGLFLQSLKKISLLELPELVSISSGLWIAPNLERMVIFYCPKLEKLSTLEVSSTELKVIKGEKEWWDALKWYESDLSTEHEDYLARLFIPLRREGDLMAQLTED